MFVDNNQEVIHLVGKPNENTLVIGDAGKGKTYAGVRMIEEAVREGEAVLVLDGSGSYSLEEMEKHKLPLSENDRYYDFSSMPPSEYEFEVCCGSIDEFSSVCMHALENAMEIGSYIQKALLKEALRDLASKYEGFSLHSLFHYLKMALTVLTEGSGDIADQSQKSNYDFLCRRFELFEDYQYASVFIRCCMTPLSKCKTGGVTIAQLTGYPEAQRKMMIEMLLALVWQQTVQSKQNPKIRAPFDVVILDEIHNLNLQAGSNIYSMLREGRKYALRVILSTQYISNYNTEVLSALLQAGIIIFFRPTLKDMKLVNESLQEDETVDWKPILRKLEEGEAILKGQYTVGDGRFVSEKPIRVSVVRAEDFKYQEELPSLVYAEGS